MDWCKESLDDFDDLRTLLRECESLNSGNHVIDRMQKIIELTTRLKRSRWAGKVNHRSLYNQLENGFELAIREDFDTRKKASTP